jgi:hypothetical protein
MQSFSRVAFVAALALSAFSTAALAAPVTNMTVVGGCPSVEDDPFCFDAGNATEENVALVLGVDESLVTQITSGYSITGFDTQTGNWSVTDSSITHLAFKADGYYILGELTGTSGVWSTSITEWTPDITTLTCPAGICNPVARQYTVADFLNGGGQVADLSNVRAFSVVPVPAAVWLFGSALGMLVWVRRKVA